MRQESAQVLILLPHGYKLPLGCLALGIPFTALGQFCLFGLAHEGKLMALIGGLLILCIGIWFIFAGFFYSSEAA